MPPRKTSQITPRNLPKQARSNELVASVLEAAAQVLAKEGAHRFTTARVAERAGVSVGSIYQYFPNKASILFRLQSDEWRQTTSLLCDILADTQKPHLGRLRLLVHSFIASECEEAPVRLALDEAASFYRDEPEAKQARQSATRTIRAFIKDVLPHSSQAARALAGDLIMTTMSASGKQFSERPRTPAEIRSFADAMADMFCAYLVELKKQAPL
jgi:AcrR family transcriptional regulator